MIKIQGGFGTDYAYLLDAPGAAQAEQASFTGTAGSVQDRTDGLALALGSAGSVTYQQTRGLTAPMPCSLRFAADRLTLTLQAGHTGGTIEILTPGTWRLEPGQTGATLVRRNGKHRVTVTADVSVVTLVPYDGINTQPDAMIRTVGTTDYLGNDIYGTTGEDQTVTKASAVGAVTAFDVLVENDGAWNDSFTLSGTPGNSAWTVQYFLVQGATETDITPAVVQGTYTTALLEMGESAQVRIKVTQAAGADDDFPVTLLATSKSSTAAQDAVIAVAALAKPDMWIRNSYDTYLGDDIHNTDGANQTKNQQARVGTTVMYLFQVQNDGPATDTLKVTGTAGGNGWSIYYKDTATNANVTTAVTGSGWSTGPLAAGAKKGLYVQLVPSASLALGSMKTLTITAASTTDGSRTDIVKAITTATPNYQPDLWIRPSTETAYFGDHRYSSDGLNQTKSLSVATGTTAMFLFQVQNDAVTTDSFKVTVPPAATAG